MKETILWGCKVDEPDYMEEVLYSRRGYVNKKSLMEAGEEWAKQNGYDRLRIAVIDPSTPPNFGETVNKGQ